MPSNRDRIRDAIGQSGADAPAEGRSTEQTNTLARKLSTKFPQSGLTINTITDEIREAEADAKQTPEGNRTAAE